MTLKELKKFLNDIPEEYNDFNMETMNSESYSSKMEINGYFLDKKENKLFITNLYVVPRL